ncbi:MAG: carboxypeptidase regulatory-like domain-containing protein [Proteobacteria bacterium]|nr:carboxypeptidase regulatory-like domain-containing protein [Pseudomonadota bacterium]
MRAAATLLCLTACGGTSFTGDVVDQVGAPVPDALVTVVGTLCQTRTDAAGHFDLGCKSARDDVTVSVGQSGYLSADHHTKVTDAKAYATGVLTLVGVPEGEGLFLRTGATYAQPERGLMMKSVVERPETVSSFCIKREETPVNPVPAGEVVLFDKAHEGWRIWIVGDDGCVYKKRRVGRGEWEQTFGDKLDASIQDVGSDRRLASITLEPGEYFLAEWGQGFFRPDKSVEARQVHYGGYLLKVE